MPPLPVSPGWMAARCSPLALMAPTDAAGGFVDSTTQAALKAQGCDIFATLADNDAYHALQKCNGLIITGPTGTNVNDVSVALVRA